MGKRRALLAAAAAAGVLGASLGALAFWFEPRSLRVVPHAIAVNGWPERCAGLRVAVLSDLHVGSPFMDVAALRRVVALAMGARADLILLPGDFVRGARGGAYVPPEAIAAELGRLSAPLGVWAVLGNHDWWDGAPRVRAALQDAGIGVLEDASARVGSGACVFSLAGISDFWEGAHDVALALAGIPEGEAVLAFTHNPDVFPDVPERVSLTIAGHTHGGQVALPWLGRPIVPSRYGQRYASGLTEEAGRQLFVSTGIGTSILPVRFRVPPQISLLTLRPAAATSEREATGR